MSYIQTKTFNNIPLSVLDTATVNQGSYPREAFLNSIDLVKRVEYLGFHRYWLAEHHNMPGMTSSATSVFISHIAHITKQIRVGAGGIVFPYHTPLLIAEQFGTLESLYPGRIDLGLGRGRALGIDQPLDDALNRTIETDDFPTQLEALLGYFSDHPDANVHAVPGQGLNIPIWLLGSSEFNAKLSAEQGLPFAFASHLGPKNTLSALRVYRENFKPSATLKKPYAMVSVNVIAAETKEQAELLATSQQQSILHVLTGNPVKLKPPVDNMEELYPAEKLTALKQGMLHPSATIVGDSEMVEQGLKDFLDETKADEIIIYSQIYDHEARIQSYERIANMMD